MNKGPILVSLAALTCMLFAFAAGNETPVSLAYPDTWPKPTYDFDKNPLTQEKIELGRRLFYDPILSADNTISCASCHLSFTAFTHTDHSLSHGIYDSIGTRNSPTLINLAWIKNFMWDGAVNHLDAQPLAPISHPAEMGSNIQEVIIKLQKSGTYPARFAHVFGDSIITGEHFLKAIAQFQLTFVSSNSKYDRVKLKDEKFTEQEDNGYRLFKENCNSCHAEPLFTSNEFANNGLAIDPTLNDFGRGVITKSSDDSLKFKVPTLRNIQYSMPYMHDGRFQSLNEVLKHYTEGIDSSSNQLSAIKSNISLSKNERIDLVTFLLTLSDKDFLLNPKLAHPRNL